MRTVQPACSTVSPVLIGATYTDAIARIHNWTAVGDIYEVNYTYRACA